MARTITLGDVYFDIKGNEFIPVGFYQGALKKPSSIWADQNGRKAKTYFDGNGRRLKKGKFFKDKNHSRFQRLRLLNKQKAII